MYLTKVDSPSPHKNVKYTCGVNYFCAFSWLFFNLFFLGKAEKLLALTAVNVLTTMVTVVNHTGWLLWMVSGEISILRMPIISQLNKSLRPSVDSAAVTWFVKQKNIGRLSRYHV
jgi:hypothetical protein